MQDQVLRVTYLPAVDLVSAGPGDDPAAALRENVERLDRVITPPVLAHLVIAPSRLRAAPEPPCRACRCPRSR